MSKFSARFSFARLRISRTRSSLAWLLVLTSGIAAGCDQSTRRIAIVTTPPDALIRVDDVETVQAPTFHQFNFANNAVHHIYASRFGYSDQDRALRLDSASNALVDQYKDPDGNEVTEALTDDLRIVLPARRRKLTFLVAPVPGVITLDGKPLSPGPVSQITSWIEFGVDSSNNWIAHTLTVNRPGYPEVSRSVRWTDAESIYPMQLEPYRKDLHITTRPPGGEVVLDGDSSGIEPVSIKSVAFPVDPNTGKFLPRKVVVRKPGYDPVEGEISWDNGRGDYVFDIPARSKLVQISVDPTDAVLSVPGAELRRDAPGRYSSTLNFAPADDKGTPRIYEALAVRQQPNGISAQSRLTIGWDDAQKDYAIKLTEVNSKSLPLVRPRFAFSEGRWRVSSETVQTDAPLDVSDLPIPALPGLSVTPVLRVPSGDTVDSLATSPDGTQIVFVILLHGSRAELHSQLQVLDVDPSGPAGPRKPRALGDDQNLALTPAFSPDGKQVLFSSNRDGKRLGIWTIPTDGSSPAVKLNAVASGDGDDLWPSLDSMPHPRLFFESLLDSRPEPRIFYARLGDGGIPVSTGTDMGQPGRQPHINPQADTLLYVDTPDRSVPTKANHQLFTIPDTGGKPVPVAGADSDDTDPAWSKDGGRIAFSSNRPGCPAPAGNATVAHSQSHDFNIWFTDAAQPDRPIQVTSNTALDDCPAWDATGKAIYFRSNRGGVWGIWKVTWR